MPVLSREDTEFYTFMKHFSNMKKYVTLALAMAILQPLHMIADKIPADKAISIATQFINSHDNATGIKKAPAQESQLSMAAETDGHYIFNVSGNGGYIIVAADGVAGSEVLGYSNSGNIDTLQMPENMRWWLSEYDRQIEYMTANSASFTSAAATNKVQAAKASSKYRDIAPLLTCSWGQNSPYNMYCPTDNGDVCPTGCVATAAAQVLYYHKWPDTMEGKHNDTDFSTVTYNWNLMLDSYNSSSSQASKQEVAKLMRNLGIATDMKYSASSSGTYSTLLRSALSDYFKCYDATLQQRDYMTASAWTDIIYDELQRQRPVYFSGYTSSGGHAFVCDGIKDGYLHINWGWKGLADGYFLPDAMEPEVQGTGGSVGAFNYGQQIITGIYNPNLEENKYLRATCTNSSLTLSKSYVKRSEEITFSGYFRVITNESRFALGLKVIDQSGNITYLIANDTITNAAKNTSNIARRFTVSMKNFPQATGTFYVYPAAYGCDSKSWYAVVATSRNYLSMTAEADASGISFSQGTDTIVSATELETPDVIYADEDTEFGTTITSSVGNFSGNIYVGFEKGDSIIYEQAEGSPFSITEGTSKKLTLTVTTPEEADTYSIAVYTESNGEKVRIGTPKSITLKERLAELYIYSALTIDNYTDLDPSAFKLVAYVRCLNKDFSGDIGLAIADNETDSVVERMTKTVTLGLNSIAHYSFSGALMNVEPGKIYNTKLYTIGKDGSWVLIRSKEGASGPLNNKLFRVSNTATAIQTIDINDRNSEEAKIFSSDGKLIMQTNRLSEAMQSLPSGLYIVKTEHDIKKIHK